MKIVDVEAIPLFVPVEGLPAPPFHVRHADRVGGVLFRGYGTTLVRIRTDEGLEGFGECGSRMAPGAAKALVEALSPIVVGQDPRAHDVLWTHLYAALETAGHSKGFFLEAISGIDIALWDIAGKAANLPVHVLLGGPYRLELPAYASALNLMQSYQELEQRARSFADQGYKMVKAKIGQNPEAPDAELDKLSALVAALGDDLAFVVDANGMFDFRTALRVGRALETLGVVWFEEPLTPTARAGQAELAQRLDLAIAGGESEHSKYHFRDIATSRAYDILQPNVARAGGLTECRKIVALCEAFHLRYAPHVGTSSAVCIAASLQLAAAAAPFLSFEHMGPGWSPNHPNPLRLELAGDPVEVVTDGKVAVPTRPGLGITIDEDLLERYRSA